MKEVGIGTRVMNFVIDTVLIALLAFALHKWYAFYVYYYYYPSYQYYWFFYFTMFVYYLIFELLFGRTPAKWITMTRVRNEQGKRPYWYWILVRSLVRLIIIDPFFIPF